MAVIYSPSVNYIYIKFYIDTGVKIVIVCVKSVLKY